MKAKPALSDMNALISRRAEKQKRMREIIRTWLRWKAEQAPNCTKTRLAKVNGWPLWFVSQTLNMTTAGARQAYDAVVKSQRKWIKNNLA